MMVILARRHGRVSDGTKITLINFIPLSSLEAAYDTNHILIRHQVTQPNTLRNMPRARTPHKRILERIFQTPMNLITNVLNRRFLTHNQRLREVWINTLALGVDAQQAQVLPAAVHHVCDTHVKLAGHDDGLGFAGERIEEVEGDGIDLVVYVEAVDVGAVIGEDDIDEVVDGDVFVADEDFAVQHLVVAEDIVKHLLIDFLGWRSKRDFHAACLLLLEVDVADILLAIT